MSKKAKFSHVGGYGEAAIAKVMAMHERSQAAVNACRAVMKLSTVGHNLQCAVCGNQQLVELSYLYPSDEDADVDDMMSSIEFRLFSRGYFLCNACHPRCVLCQKQINFFYNEYTNHDNPAPVHCGEPCILTRTDEDDYATNDDMKPCRMPVATRCKRHKGVELDWDAPPSCVRCLRCWAFWHAYMDGKVEIVHF